MSVYAKSFVQLVDISQIFFCWTHLIFRSISHSYNFSFNPFEFLYGTSDPQWPGGGHSASVVIHLPPTSEVDGSNPRLYVGKLVVAY